MLHLPLYVQGAWLIGAVMFIFGLKGMGSPTTARKGIVWAGVGMLVAIVGTFLVPDLNNIALILLALVIGASAAWISGKKVQMTDMPQMVAIYNGMGGGAAAAIAAIEFAKAGRLHEAHDTVTVVLAVLGALIGSVSFTGSCIAFAKLQGLMKKAHRLPAQNIVNIGLAVLAVILGVLMVINAPAGIGLVVAFFVVALVLGVVVTMPIGGADMPVVISLFNAFTGLAVGFEGYVLGNPALIIAGIVVGAAGTLLTQLMAKAMNRPISNILFSPITGEAQGGAAIEGTMKELNAMDAAALMRYASKVIIVPGYGMAVAHAQHKVWEMAGLLEKAGVEVKFAIHPVAGRMPGHMNVLLAEAGVPYDKIFDLDE
ncbi:MAG: NAD(P)(+) transhydrogenase (Re/Si-specific) subunit beta, partial [Burkholderiales bacterium]|nr:NAD(P)(+) transhydrogenase (Re/Si-specific) subunit beta [Burkholderiales bacterium]